MHVKHFKKFEKICSTVHFNNKKIFDVCGVDPTESPYCLLFHIDGAPYHDSVWKYGNGSAYINIMFYAPYIPTISRLGFSISPQNSISSILYTNKENINRMVKDGVYSYSDFTRYNSILEPLTVRDGYYKSRHQKNNIVYLSQYSSFEEPYWIDINDIIHTNNTAETSDLYILKNEYSNFLLNPKYFLNYLRGSKKIVPVIDKSSSNPLEVQYIAVFFKDKKDVHNTLTNYPKNKKKGLPVPKTAHFIDNDVPIISDYYSSIDLNLYLTKDKREFFIKVKKNSTVAGVEQMHLSDKYRRVIKIDRSLLGVAKLSSKIAVTIRAVHMT